MMEERSSVPEWLLKDENYNPQADKDTFINKSILSLFGLLSKIRLQDTRKTTKHEVNAVFKVAFTFILIVLISLSRGYSFLFVADVYLLVVLSMMESRAIIEILKVSLVMAIFTFIIMLPAVFWGNSYSCILITVKVFTTITAIGILTRSTRWNAITGALRRFFIPDIFIFVFDITLKYIVLLGEFTLNLLYALKLRSVGKNKSKYVSLSGIAGTMFIKSKEMAEDMYGAMACRGFTGEYHVHKRNKFTFMDFSYIIVNAAILAAFIFWGRV
jgi:ABC-type cobalt transport system, permease component CbiQ and related transporters